MSERYYRCRFWPRCIVHLGEPRPRLFSRTNLLEMVELRREGAQVADIAQTFGASSKTVIEVLAASRRRVGAR